MVKGNIALHDVDVPMGTDRVSIGAHSRTAYDIMHLNEDHTENILHSSFDDFVSHVIVFSILPYFLVYHLPLYARYTLQLLIHNR